MFPLKFDGARGGLIKVDGVRLGPWDEVVGTLDRVEKREERVVFRISSIRQITVEIPLDELVKGDLDFVQLIGQKISILRTCKDYILKQSEPDRDTGSKAS